jgi:hypothetical protein
VGVATQDPHSRLAELIRTRRLSQRLSASAAARLADVDRDTWSSAEKGARRLREYNYSGFERALRWSPGSIEAVLAGGEPTLLAEGQAYDDEMAIIDRAPVSDAAKERMRAYLTQLREQDRQRRMSSLQILIDEAKGA